MIFDGANKIIILETADGNNINVVDLYSRWKDWVLTNPQFLPAFLPTGGDDIDLSAGTSIPLYAFLTNGWRVRPREASHTLNITGGILLVEGGGDPFLNTLGSFVVRINYQQPVQAIGVSSSSSGGSVWDELVASHATPGTFGRVIKDINLFVKILLGR